MTSRVLFLIVTFVTAAGTAAAAAIPDRPAAFAGRKPNVIYVMADELGYYEPGFMGGQNIHTPALDRMAAEGIRFDNLFAGSSVCAPTRCCLLTGRHAGHASIRANDGGTPLRADEVTIASMLQPLGYATGGFGKWGCGGRDSTGVPEKHGFDVFLGYYDQVHAHTYYPPYLIRNSEEIPLEGNSGGSAGRTYAHYVIHEAALDFIRAAATAKQPFFAYLAYTPPHGIFDIPDTDPAWQLYADRPWPEPARRYAAMVSMVDRQVGEVLALLAELGIDDDTLVFFSGDNGGADYFASPEFPRGVHGANRHPQTGVEFRGKKGELYEGGLRIPFVARWPSMIRPGRVSKHLGYFPDVLPTVAEVTGATPPVGIDGISLVPELLGPQVAERGQPRHEYLYWEINGWIAIRQGAWRAVKRPTTDAWELYDLAADASESRNVAPDHPDVLAGLTALAVAASEPARPGTFSRTDRHERDRRAKIGEHNLGGNAATETAKPNIVLILVDDMGFSDIGCYGSEIPTPHIDALAAGGLRFTHFYNDTRCSPTRAALLTGRYNNKGFLHDRCVTIAEVLTPAGYFTIHTGKWHVGSTLPQWPAQRGFDRNYTVPQGGGFYFRPTLGVDRQPRFIIEGNRILYRDGGAEPPPGWYSTDAFADYGIEYIGEALMEKKPFFLYLAFNAPHFPLQAPPADIAKFRGRYMKGWDDLRNERHARQIGMGIVDKKWPLTPRDPRVRAWDELSEEEKNEQDERMAIYAAVVSRMDQAIGRVVDYLQKQGVFENTLILFLSDNGGSNEGGVHGSNTKPGVPGTQDSHVFYGSCWANASNAPFRLYKKWVHEGGIATPLIAHWPAGIRHGGTLTDEVGHVIDIMATCADVGGAEYPKAFNGQEIPPLEGLSLAPVFRTGKRDGHDALCWAHAGNFAVRSGKWKLVSEAGGQWELFDIDADRTELHDLAARFPDKVKTLAEKWEAWAGQHAIPRPVPSP